MSKTISLCPQTLQVLRWVDERLMSYNIEMTEVTGGTFWKAYSPEQIAGKEPFPPVKDFSQVAGLMQVYDPIGLYNPKLRAEQSVRTGLDSRFGKLGHQNVL